MEYTFTIKMANTSKMASDRKRLLELRKELKKKKPTFLRTDAHKKKRIEDNWRRPRGRHNKIRLCKKGHRKKPSPGYRSPKEVRGLDRSGLKPIIVKNVSDLMRLDSATEGAIVGKNVGKRKRAEIAKKGIELGITFLNFNPKKFLEALEKEQKAKQEKKKAEAEKKKEKKEDKEELKEEKEEKKKEKEEKKPTEEKKTPEEEKEELEKEKEKVLIKKR